MGCKVVYYSVALLLYLMICEHVRAQCTQPSFKSRNVILSESFITTQSFPSRSTVTFECEVGHVRDPVNPRASKSVTCEGNQWTSLELNCIKKSCGSPPDFLHGKYEITGISFGDKITAVCDPGYILAGQMKDRWCREQGWDGRDPVCEAVKCEAPPVIENGQLVDQPLDTYDYAQVVSYRCNKGFSLIGSSDLHCSEDGTFKPDPPKCSKGCTKPEIPHAIRIGGRLPPYELGSYLDYKCEEGYKMDGESHILCTAEGWKPEPPKCNAPLTTTATTTTPTKVTSKTLPKDALLTTTTTATKVTSKIDPKDGNTNSSRTSKIVGSTVGVAVLCLAAVIVLVIYKKRSKHEKVATGNEVDKEL
ncbi:complement component receptor 1-like protein isoform X5 [Ctenopharyngodon idella]|uniref:complement component receptor 1-like protein isoform X5 n=1 Tax=Ctenopharyngodon idella TaxID=7959 RepID=UPI00222E7978|nr:complement component receptor 1-like protein isoform X5 [Ctenopharyngodon idella]